MKDNKKDLQIGLVLKSTGSWYEIESSEGLIIPARVRGKVRLNDYKSTNPIAVGDKVYYEKEGENAQIDSLIDRRNYIIRKSNNLSKQTQVIAANLDQAMLVVTLAFPHTSLGFIDRFLLTAEAYHIPSIIVFNKIDIYDEAALGVLEEYEKIYSSIPYPIFRVSAKDGRGLEELKSALKGKTTLISGHSGVGKSTLLNAIIPGLEQKTGEISNYSLKGKHTTTFAEMFKMDENSRIIDTPGIKDFGIVDIKDHEISGYFPEMRKFISDCKFSKCLHLNEPKCAVIDAVEQGLINEYRYESYLSILRNEETHH